MGTYLQRWHPHSAEIQELYVALLDKEERETRVSSMDVGDLRLSYVVFGLGSFFLSTVLVYAGS